MKLIEFIIDIFCDIFMLSWDKNAESDRKFYTPRNVVLFVVVLLVIVGIALAFDK